MGKEGYLFYNVVNEKETGKVINPQINILETKLICQLFKLKISFMRVSGDSGNNIFSVSKFKFHLLTTKYMKKQGRSC
jgi:hypothetical protein